MDNNELLKDLLPFVNGIMSEESVRIDNTEIFAYSRFAESMDEIKYEFKKLTESNCQVFLHDIECVPLSSIYDKKIYKVRYGIYNKGVKNEG